MTAITGAGVAEVSTSKCSQSSVFFFSLVLELAIMNNNRADLACLDHSSVSLGSCRLHTELHLRKIVEAWLESVTNLAHSSSHVGTDHRPSIGQMPNFSGRSLAIVPGPNIKMSRAAGAGYLTMGHLWNSSLNWWQIDHGPVKNLRPAEYWPIVLTVGLPTLTFSAEPGLGLHWIVTITNTFCRVR